MLLHTSENVQIACPCCDTVISLHINGFRRSPIKSTGVPMYMPDYSDIYTGTNARANDLWVGSQRDEEIRRTHVRPYCICSTDSHDEDREYAHACMRCGTDICAHAKCRHSHEKYDCEDNRKARQQLKEKKSSRGRPAYIPKKHHSRHESSRHQ